MLPKQALAWMVNLEKSIGNLAVSYGPVDIWPIIRNSLILAVLNESGKPWPARKQNLGRAKRLFRSVLSLICAERVDILFVTDTKYSECIEGQYYIKDVDGVARMDECRGKSLKLAFSDEPDRPLYHDTKGAVSFYALRILASVLTKIVCQFPTPRQVSNLLDDACDNYAASGSLSVSASVMRKRLKNNIIFSYFSATFLRMLFKRIRPEKVFVHCYYSPFGMALCAAAKSCGVQVTDVQHGLAGRNMRAYGQWENSPVGGFSTMPSRFFSWTESDAKAINEWSHAVGMGQIAVCTGHMWLKEFLCSSLHARALSEWSSFLKRISNFRKVVVISMQAWSIDELWSELIREGDNNICFLLRGHPNVQINGELGEIAQFIVKHDNVFFSEPTLMPLPLLLSRSDLHITSWSASVYESIYLKKNTVVTSETGVDYFDGIFSGYHYKAILDKDRLLSEILD